MNEAGIHDEGTTMKTKQGDQVLAVCATEMKAKGKLNGNTMV